MRGKEKENFIKWYNEDRSEKNGKYNFCKEFVTYCKMDVTVLRRCFMYFNEMFMEIGGGMCPLVSGTTIAGLCNKFWRTKYLEVDRIGLLPINGYHGNRPLSAKSNRWLE